MTNHPEGGLRGQIQGTIGRLPFDQDIVSKRRIKEKTWSG
jgi:hypothetical protein